MSTGRMDDGSRCKNTRIEDLHDGSHVFAASRECDCVNISDQHVLRLLHSLSHSHSSLPPVATFRLITIIIIVIPYLNDMTGRSN